MSFPESPEASTCALREKEERTSGVSDVHATAGTE
jgi:hypothetical protein